MKKFILIILLLSCNKIVKNIDFKNKDMNEGLAIAIINNEKDKAVELINKGANINYVHNSISVLELALNKENPEIIKELLKKGVESNKDNIVKIYDLALEDFNYDIIDLIKDKYKLEEGLIDNNKYFLLLCYISNAEEVKRFIEKHNINPKEVKDKINRNGLMLSAFGNKIDIFKMLTEEYRLDINYKNNNGITPLIAACNNNNNGELIKLLLERGANVNEKNNNGYTGLMLASQNGHTETVELLIEKGANINEKDNDYWTGLMLASINSHIEVVRLLIEKGANVNEKNNNGWTGLMIASNNGHTETVRLLIEKGVNVNEKNNGYTGLMLASQNGHTETVRLLIEKGANMDEKFGATLLNKGTSALKIAYNKGHKEIIEFLLSKGADISDFKNIQLEEILIKNIKNKEINNCLIMINRYKNKINYKYKDKEGNTLLHYSVLTNDINLFQEFLKRGCNINWQNNKGETPLYLALNQERINEDFSLYLVGNAAILNPKSIINNQTLIIMLLPYKKLFSKLILEPITRKLLGKFTINNENKNILREIICILNLKDEDFENEKEMINYIKNIFLLKNNNLNLSLEDLEKIRIERENLVNFELDADYILGAAFDLGQDEYYGDNAIENTRETFKNKLIDILQVKTPKSIPSEDAADPEKAQYVKYLTKKRLRLLSLRLSEIPENQRKENLGWVMNNILTNLSCPTGTLIAINYAVNCLLGNDNEVLLKDVINKELMLYRISLLEEVARNHLDNKCVSIMLDEIGKEAGRGKGVYSEHMKAYLVMDLYEELKVTGLYEKDFKYIYDKALVIREVKRLYKERALNYIVNYIIENKSLNNKVIEYLEKEIFKNRKLEQGEKLTVFHIENFIYDEDLMKLTKEAVIALLMHFKLLK